MTTAAQFNRLRFLLGVAEAGFFPGIILFLSQWAPEARLLGEPVSAALLSLHGLLGLAGWRWLPNRPHQARWLQLEEAQSLEQMLHHEREQRQTRCVVPPGCSADKGV